MRNDSMIAVKNKISLATSLMLALSLPTIAQADWGVGFDVSNQGQRYKNAKEKTWGLLNFQYRGEKLNIGHQGISYEFSNNEKYAIEALLASNNYGYEDNDSKILKGMDKRDASIDLGGRVIINTAVGPAVFSATKDVNSSKGYEAEFKLGGIAPHSKHWTGHKEFKVAAVAGVRYQSKKVTNYYYGVKQSEATANRRAYKADAATTPYIGVETQMDISPHFTINGGLTYEKRAKSIRNSPITDNKKYQPVANIGFTYWF